VISEEKRIREKENRSLYYTLKRRRLKWASGKRVSSHLIFGEEEKGHLVTDGGKKKGMGGCYGGGKKGGEEGRSAPRTLPKYV